jgi:hypothetical protein
MLLESNDGVLSTVRFGGQLQMVHADEYHSLPKQGGSIQAEAWTITPKQLLPGLLRRE